MNSDQTRTYQRATSVVFLKTKEHFGGLSNMAGGFPLRVNGIRIRTSEALYQACRFPHLPEVQSKIIAQKSPMTAKMKSKPHRRDSRPDWDEVRVTIMRWCLRVKLAQNWGAFSKLLLETGDRPIVEESRKDAFWGAKPTDDRTLVGMNVLGRLLMELREVVKSEDRESLWRVQPIEIRDFRLAGRPIERVTGPGVESPAVVEPRVAEPSSAHVSEAGGVQGLLFDRPAIQETPRGGSPRFEIAGLKPYPAMKDSGVEWLGEVPQHWEIWRTRYLFTEIDRRSKTGEETHLSMSQRLGLVPSDQVQSSLTSESYVGGKLCEREDLVLNRLKAHLGVFALANQAGVISPDYSVFRSRCASNMTYFEHSLRSPACRGELRVRAKGIVEGFWRLYTDDFYDIRLPVPPLSEQAAIVRYLDHVDRRVRRLVRAKRKLIALLKEQKQAIIHRVVTRGLDPNVRRKDSGVEWLGEVPEHWEVRKLKQLTRFHNGLAFKPSDWGSEGVPIIRIQNLNGSNDFNYTARDDLPKSLLIGPGDLLFAWSGNRGTSFGSFIWDRDFPGYLNQHIFKLAGYSLDRVYFSHVLRAVTRHVEEEKTHGIIGLVHVTKPELGRVLVPVAPPEEQAAIVEYIDQTTRDIVTTVDRANREVELLNEYRTRLIADVVTGKLDVREPAAVIPDVDPLDAEDDLDDPLEAESDPHGLDAVPEEAES